MSLINRRSRIAGSISAAAVAVGLVGGAAPAGAYVKMYMTPCGAAATARIVPGTPAHNVGSVAAWDDAVICLMNNSRASRGLQRMSYDSLDQKRANYSVTKDCNSGVNYNCHAVYGLACGDETGDLALPANATPQDAWTELQTHASWLSPGQSFDWANQRYGYVGVDAAGNAYTLKAAIVIDGCRQTLY
jgi:hypothetical protein